MKSVGEKTAQEDAGAGEYDLEEEMMDMAATRSAGASRMLNL